MAKSQHPLVKILTDYSDTYLQAKTDGHNQILPTDFTNALAGYLYI